MFYFKKFIIYQYIKLFCLSAFIKINIFHFWVIKKMEPKLHFYIGLI